MAAIIQAAQKPFPQRFAECKQAHAAASAEPSSSHGFSWLALYLLPTDFERDANQAARTRVTVTALAVQRFRLAHQQALPEKLDDLVPTYLNSVPIDPFDGKALRFKKLEKGFVIYSVGKDGQDNDDAEFDSNNREAPIDVTFTVER
ncbi:MAG: hypothetical protein EPO07_00510 [Verrucomicrobia bacterium]|nr:MAG: hypothetical protein EPO07_00510 [Verrucomicrobiota bacterium]